MNSQLGQPKVLFQLLSANICPLGSQTENISLLRRMKRVTFNYFSLIDANLPFIPGSTEMLLLHPQIVVKYFLTGSTIKEKIQKH